MNRVGSIFARGFLCSLSLSLLIHVANSADTQAKQCEDGTLATLDHTAVHMGKDVKRWTCNMIVDSNVTTKMEHLKDFDLCTAECTTYCDESGIQAGPDPKDCKALAEYYVGAGRFTIDARDYIIWEYDTCRVTQYNRLNHGDQKISYCFDQHHWAGVVNYVSYHCGSKSSNTQRGTCYFYDSLHFSTIAVEKIWCSNLKKGGCNDTGANVKLSEFCRCLRCYTGFNDHGSQ